MTGDSRVIGIDFDNTLADYDEILRDEAFRQGLIGSGAGVGKKTVRDSVRLKEGGEILWQKLQARVYGPLMHKARVMPGAAAFFEKCRESGAAVCVVSHKSRTYPYDDTGTDYRRAALEWMEAHRFFSAAGAGLKRENVYFEDTRGEKVRRVAALGCSHFIDDLEETFLESEFPAGTEKILFDRHGENGDQSAARRISSWPEISEYLFHAVN